jgi:outer membrane protein assembly factor BamB
MIARNRGRRHRVKANRFFSIAWIGIILLLTACDEGIGPAPTAAGAPAAAAPAAVRDWPQWRGPAYDGVAPGDGFDPLSLKGLDNPLASGSPRLVWKNKIAKGYAGAAVARGRIYTMGFERQRSSRLGKDVVYCLNERTGEIVWTFDYPATASVYAGPRAMPLVRDGYVYTLSWDGKLHCLDALSGRLYWSIDVKAEYGLLPRGQEFGYCAPPVVQGDVLLLNARRWGVALDRRTGALLWASPADMSGYAPPVPFTRGGKTLAAVFGASKLYVVDVAAGTLAASADWPTLYQGNIADPIVLGDEILVSSTYEQGYGLFRLGENGLSLVYRRKGLGAQMAAGVAIDGYYYGNDYWYFYGRGEYRCLEIATGRTMWKAKQGMGSVIAVGKTLLLLSESGKLTAAPADPNAFTELASCQLGVKRKGEWFTPPTFANGRLYVRNYSGDVFCLDLGKR